MPRNVQPCVTIDGGKWRLAKWIISFFPPHTNYVEPCMGACSVLLQKPRSPLETINDLDGNVVNFFRVLRDQPEELIRKIRLTPWARAEFEVCRFADDNTLENARRFYISAMMGMGRAPFDPTTAPRMVTDCRMMYSLTSVQITDETTKHLYEIGKRFQGVQIEESGALEMVCRFDNDSALIYFDPPYVMETRTGGQGYHDLEWTNEDHEDAAWTLHSCLGYVVVSGYACPLYTELYEDYGWTRYDKEAQTNSGGKRIESLWLSPRTVEALNMPVQAALL